MRPGVVVFLWLTITGCVGSYTIENCAKFTDLKHETVAKRTVTLSFNIVNACGSSVTGVYADYLKPNGHYGGALCRFELSNGICDKSRNRVVGCTCEGHGTFRVTAKLKDNQLKVWKLEGYLSRGRSFKAEHTVWADKFITSTRWTKGFISFYVLLHSIRGVIRLITFVICICIKRRMNQNRSQVQVNPRSAEVEMVPLYSRPDQDVHHYLGLPPNRHALSGDDDEGGYLDLIDSDSESGIYQVPGESPSPSNAPADYLHPLASAQEGPKLPRRRVPLSPSNAPADDLLTVASDQERPSSPTNAPADNLDQVASAQERPSSPSNAPADDLHSVASAQELPLSHSNAPADDLPPVASDQEQPSSPSNA